MTDSSQSDAEYFRRRSQQELAAAERASDPCARQLHRDLARKYQDAAADADGESGNQADAAPVLPPELRILN